MTISMEEAATLAYNVKKIRMQHGLSKTAMAGMLSISTESLRKIENGQIPPRLVVLVPFRIASSFDITPAELYSAPLDRPIEKTS